MTALSPHFTLAELTVSQTATRRGIDNHPTPVILQRLQLVAVHILEPVRAHYGRPVIVSSGYRSPTLNRAIGGSLTSQHCKGEAVDFRVSGVSNREVCKFIRETLDFDQLIYEFGEAGWVHCSYREGPRRKEVLSASKEGGRTIYRRGL